jgi:hypothetical protein
MGLDIILDACETKKFYENYHYMNVEDPEEIAFNVRCEMRTIDSVKNDYDLLDAMSVVAFYNDKEIENCQYTILEKKELEQLITKDISEEGRETLEKVLAEVDFDKETVTVYPWW